MKANNAVLLDTGKPPVDLRSKLDELRKKQQVIDAKWKSAGDRSMLSCFADLVPMALKVERFSIFVLDPKTSDVWLQCGTGLKENAIKVSVDGSIVGEVISSGHPLIVEDMEDRVGAHYDVSVQTGFHPRNTLCVPILSSASKKVATGAIQVLNKAYPGLGQELYTRKDVEMLQKLAVNIQMTIENIYLRQEYAKISKVMSDQIRLLESKLGMH